MNEYRRIPLSFNALGQKGKKLKFLAAILRAVKSGIYLNGPQGNALVQQLQQYFKAKNVVLTGSGHDALFIAVKSFSLGPEDEIIVPANAYPTVFPLVMAGVGVRLVDVDENGQIDITALTRTISSKTKGIVVVHMYGLMADMTALMHIAHKKHLFVIEDCAQAFGSLQSRKKAGTFGDIACFSFYPTKNLSTFGDGGALITTRKNLFEYARMAVSYGEERRYESQFISGHSRIPEIQAAILNVAIRDVSREGQKRAAVFRWYKEALKEANLEEYVRLFLPTPETDPMMHLVVAEVDRRDALRSFLAKKKVPTQVHYPYAVHEVAAFAHLGYSQGAFPTAERLARHILSLPYHEYLTKKDVRYILFTIKKFYES